MCESHKRSWPMCSRTVDYLMSGITDDVAASAGLERELVARLRLVEELDDDDRAVLHKLIDTFVSKHRFKTFVQENIETL